MRYPTHLKVLDIFGLMALVSAAIFAFTSDTQDGSHLSDLWGGISTEMLGIWVGVRFIEWIINSHEAATKCRVRVVRNLRHIERLAGDVAEYQRSHSLWMLLRDLKWGRDRLKTRQKYLHQNEIRDVEAFFEIVQELLDYLPSAEPRPQTKLAISDPAAFQDCVRRLEAARWKAEENILEETDEDSGL